MRGNTPFTACQTRRDIARRPPFHRGSPMERIMSILMVPNSLAQCVMIKMTQPNTFF